MKKTLDINFKLDSQGIRLIWHSWVEADQLWTTHKEAGLRYNYQQSIKIIITNISIWSNVDHQFDLTRLIPLSNSNPRKKRTSIDWRKFLVDGVKYHSSCLISLFSSIVRQSSCLIFHFNSRLKIMYISYLIFFYI